MGEEISYADVKKYAKALGINIVGKKKDIAINLVLDGVYVDYVKHQEEGGVDFEKYKKGSKEMLAWYKAHKSYNGTTPAEGESSEETDGDNDVQEPPDEPEADEEKDLSEAKEKAAVAKKDAEEKAAKVKKDAEEKKEKKSEPVNLVDGQYQAGTSALLCYQALKKAAKKGLTAEEAEKKLGGKFETTNLKGRIVRVFSDSVKRGVATRKDGRFFIAAGE